MPAISDGVCSVAWILSDHQTKELLQHLRRQRDKIQTTPTNLRHLYITFWRSTWSSCVPTKACDASPASRRIQLLWQFIDIRVILVHDMDFSEQSVKNNNYRYCLSRRKIQFSHSPQRWREQFLSTFCCHRILAARLSKRSNTISDNNEDEQNRSDAPSDGWAQAVNFYAQMMTPNYDSFVFFVSSTIASRIKRRERVGFLFAVSAEIWARLTMPNAVQRTPMEFDAYFIHISLSGCFAIPFALPVWHCPTVLCFSALVRIYNMVRRSHKIIFIVIDIIYSKVESIPKKREILLPTFSSTLCVYLRLEFFTSGL